MKLESVGKELPGPQCIYLCVRSETHSVMGAALGATTALSTWIINSVSIEQILDLNVSFQEDHLNAEF